MKVVEPLRPSDNIVEMLESLKNDIVEEKYKGVQRIALVMKHDDDEYTHFCFGHHCDIPECLHMYMKGVNWLINNS